MRLVYISPVPWCSINQRPHFFAKMAVKYGVDELLWVEPYPSRFPNFGDLLPGRHAPEPSGLANIDHVEIVSAGSLIPLEPIEILFNFFNGSRINKLINSILDFVGTETAARFRFGNGRSFGRTNSQYINQYTGFGCFLGDCRRISFVVFTVGNDYHRFIDTLVARKRTYPQR